MSGLETEAKVTFSQGVSIVEGNRNVSITGTAQSQRGRDCLHMCRGGRVGLLEEEEKEEKLREDSWMQ